MTQWRAIQRGILYVLIAILTQAIADLGSLFQGDIVSQTKFWMQISLSGLVTWRAFIDQSPSQIDQPIAKQPET